MNGKIVNRYTVTFISWPKGQKKEDSVAKVEKRSEVAYSPIDAMQQALLNMNQAFKDREMEVANVGPDDELISSFVALEQRARDGQAEKDRAVQTANEQLRKIVAKMDLRSGKPKVRPKPGRSRRIRG